MTAKQPPLFRSGQWVRFELDLPTDPAQHQLPAVLATGKQVQRITIADPLEVAMLLARFQKAKDGRYVGIYLAAAKTPLGTHDKAGNPQYAVMPACVAPQRAILGPNQEQNVTFAWAGAERTLLLPVECLRLSEALLVRDDVPKHRDMTCHANWNPRR